MVVRVRVRVTVRVTVRGRGRVRVGLVDLGLARVDDRLLGQGLAQLAQPLVRDAQRVLVVGEARGDAPHLLHAEVLLEPPALEVPG